MKTIKHKVEVSIEYPACEICGAALEPIGTKIIEVEDKSWLGLIFNRSKKVKRDLCRCSYCGNEQDTPIWDYPIEYKIIKEDNDEISKS